MAGSTFEVHVTTHPETARIIRGFADAGEAATVADAEGGVVVERLWDPIAA